MKLLPEPPCLKLESDEKKAARQRDRRVRQALQVVLDELIADYANSERGMEIREIARGYRMATKPEYHDAVRGFCEEPEAADEALSFRPGRRWR